MEAYGSSCTGTVVNFLAGWNRQVRARGYRAGFYSSMASGIRDLVANPAVWSDEVWFARWDGVATTTDPGIPAGLWTNHQRLKQYAGGHRETFGGVTINIDSDECDYTP